MSASDHSRNQTHSRKKQGRNQEQPSKAPGQDEPLDDVRPVEPDRGRSDADSRQQGISNRPAREEHAFPDSDAPADGETGDVDLTIPPQQGGNRGGT